LDFLIIVGATWPVISGRSFCFPKQKGGGRANNLWKDEKHTPATPEP